MEAPVCKNIRSRNHPDQRCPNPAISGEYCGIHAKHPRPFATEAQTAIKLSNKDKCDSLPITGGPESARAVQRWWRMYFGMRSFQRQGPARWNRTVSTNTCDFYSMEDIGSISGEYLFSFLDTDKMVYAFDIRSMASLLEKSDAPQNPYNRKPLSDIVLKSATNYIKWCRRKGVDTRWAPIVPETPDQRFQLKVVDLFQKIDELNYYTNPSWFTSMTIDDHRCFYVELHDIWYHRAELSTVIRDTIVPPPARPFRYPVREIVAQKSLEFLRKSNMDLIRMFISAAADRTDRILGAMYVITAMTLISHDCASQYPWLFESASPGIYARYRLFNTPPPALQIQTPSMDLLNMILGVPLFALPPPLPGDNINRFNETINMLNNILAIPPITQHNAAANNSGSQEETGVTAAEWGGENSSINDVD